MRFPRDFFQIMHPVSHAMNGVGRDSKLACGSTGLGSTPTQEQFISTRRLEHDGTCNNLDEIVVISMVSTLIFCRRRSTAPFPLAVCTSGKRGVAKYLN